MKWHALTFSWNQVRDQRHLTLAQLIEKDVKHRSIRDVGEAKMQAEMLTGGKMRIYLSPGVMHHAGEWLLKEGAVACDEPPIYFPTTFSIKA